MSDERCDDRECRVPPAYVVVHGTTRRGRDCAVRCSAVRGAGVQLPMKRGTPGRVYIGSRPGTSPRGEGKGDRRPNPTRHQAGQHAGQTARVAYGSVSPTPTGAPSQGATSTPVALATADWEPLPRGISRRTTGRQPSAQWEASTPGWPPPEPVLLPPSGTPLLPILRSGCPQYANRIF